LSLQDFLSKKSPNAWKSRREESATQKIEEDANYDVKYKK
jgi:hypothetical protein